MVLLSGAVAVREEGVYVEPDEADEAGAAVAEAACDEEADPRTAPF